MLNYTSEVFDKINDSFLPATYEADERLQKVIHLVKNKEEAKISACVLARKIQFL